MKRIRVSHLLSRVILAIAGLVVVPAATAASERPAAPAPIVELRVEPGSLALAGPRDARRFVIRGRTVDGSWVDLTPTAASRVSGDVARLEDGFVEPVKDGQAVVLIEAAGKQARLSVTVTGQGAAAPVSFVRDVMPVLGKSGCNAGTCHGGAKGRNGFKLSLRGYDPGFDYEQIVEDIAGRRIDRKEPANSLVLLKPTQGVPHEGGLIFEENWTSWSTKSCNGSRCYPPSCVPTRISCAE